MAERSCRRLMVLLTGRLPEDECPSVLNVVLGKGLFYKDWYVSLADVNSCCLATGNFVFSKYAGLYVLKENSHDYKLNKGLKVCSLIKTHNCFPLWILYDNINR